MKTPPGELEGRREAHARAHDALIAEAARTEARGRPGLAARLRGLAATHNRLSQAAHDELIETRRAMAQYGRGE